MTSTTEQLATDSNHYTNLQNRTVYINGKYTAIDSHNAQFIAPTLIDALAICYHFRRKQTTIVETDSHYEINIHDNFGGLLYLIKTSAEYSPTN